MIGAVRWLAGHLHHGDTLTVTDRSMSSPLTEETATRVGAHAWVVSFLPGRTLPDPQAEAAMRFAEVITELRLYATALGMTPAEVAGYIAMQRAAVSSR